MRAAALGLSSLAISALPEPTVDDAGRPAFRAEFAGGALVGILNEDGTIRALAVTNPPGGDGAASGPSYLLATLVQTLLVEVLTLEQEAMDRLGLTDRISTTRAGLDTTYSTPDYQFHFVSTADNGDWLVVTAIKP
ncbi:MAG TPA: hypothetical protein VEX41_03830 [Candidatus Eisenbacteria bacterium]|nr:hypothetical protein [Candidatus Eisenbacteria bacterium]